MTVEVWCVVYELIAETTLHRIGQPIFSHAEASASLPDFEWERNPNTKPKVQVVIRKTDEAEDPDDALLACRDAVQLKYPNYTIWRN
jgi:hypothetical protein